MSLRSMTSFDLGTPSGRDAAYRELGRAAGEVQTFWPPALARAEAYAAKAAADSQAHAAALPEAAQRIQAAVSAGNVRGVAKAVAEAALPMALAGQLQVVTGWTAERTPMRAPLADWLAERANAAAAHPELLPARVGYRATMRGGLPSPPETFNFAGASQAISGRALPKRFRGRAKSNQALMTEANKGEALQSAFRARWHQIDTGILDAARAVDARALPVANGLALATAAAAQADAAAWRGAAAAADDREWPALEQALVGGPALVDRAIAAPLDEAEMAETLTAFTAAGTSLAEPARLRDLVTRFAERPRLVALAARSIIGQDGLAGWTRAMARAKLNDLPQLDPATLAGRALLRALETPLVDPVEAAALSPEAVVPTANGDWIRPVPDLALRVSAIDMIWQEDDRLHVTLDGDEQSYPIGEELAIAVTDTLRDRLGFVALDSGLLLNPGRIAALDETGERFVLGATEWQEPLAETDLERLQQALGRDTGMLKLAGGLLLRTAAIDGAACTDGACEAVVLPGGAEWDVTPAQGRQLAHALVERHRFIALDDKLIAPRAVAALRHEDGEVVAEPVDGPLISQTMALDEAGAFLRHAGRLPGFEPVSPQDVLNLAQLVGLRWEEDRLEWRLASGHEGGCAMGAAAAEALLAQMESLPGMLRLPGGGVVQMALFDAVTSDGDGGIVANLRGEVLYPVEPDSDAEDDAAAQAVAEGIVARTAKLGGFQPDGVGGLLRSGGVAALERQEDGVALRIGGDWMQVEMAPEQGLALIQRVLDGDRFDTLGQLPTATVQANLLERLSFDDAGFCLVPQPGHARAIAASLPGPRTRRTRSLRL